MLVITPNNCRPTHHLSESYQVVCGIASVGSSKTERVKINGNREITTGFINISRHFQK